ncbi:hypothetical protein NEMBOFW57_010889 [Staphylotrichum longicolle]|uniref:Extracellular membrane protein CFEM domain-containing protein n=1 Tax=Staphylotrichum longicolle TaxID=669026 RepID=A0AAD4ENU0_9PEZI|nr:hypothetical protein NEMBOFW57_010889 [Staphylotrichum longicolle]
MIALNPVGLALIFLWMITASANPQLRPVFRAAAAYNGLSSDQRKCAVDDTYAVVYKSACKDKDCFCASPQFMSDTADACLLFYSDFLTPHPEIYSAENYNSIMMFFGNECGTFQVQTKVGNTNSNTSNNQGSDQAQKSEGGGGGLSIGAWIGIAASILSAIAACVSIWYKCCRNPDGHGKKDSV